MLVPPRMRHTGPVRPCAQTLPPSCRQKLVMMRPADNGSMRFGSPGKIESDIVELYV